MLRFASSVLAVALAALALSAYPEGPTARAGDRTGSPLNATPQRCGTCHAGGAFAPRLTATLRDDDGRRGTYVPGATYTLRVVTEAAGAPAGYGFQVVALDERLAAAGAYGEPPEGFQVTELDGRPYVEHARLQSRDTLEVEWTAPPAGTGTVTVYAAGNAVNGADGSFGDNAAEDVLTLAEARAVATADPNPADVRVLARGRGRYRLSLPAATDVRGLSLVVHDALGRGLLTRALASAQTAFELPRGAGPAYVTLVRDGRPVFARALVR